MANNVYVTYLYKKIKLNLGIIVMYYNDYIILVKREMMTKNLHSYICIIRRKKDESY